MPSTHIATAYAQTLYQIALQQTILSQVYTDACTLLSVSNTNPKLNFFLKNPILTVTYKQQLLQRILQPYLHDQTLTFLLFVIKQKRSTHLIAIIKAFITQYKKYKKIQIAHITTTQKLQPSLKKQFTALTTKLTGHNTVELIEHTQPRLLGGYILQIDDKQIDASLHTKLKSLKRLITTKQ